jgi:hypothetical protein
MCSTWSSVNSRRFGMYEMNRFRWPFHSTVVADGRAGTAPTRGRCKVAPFLDERVAPEQQVAGDRRPEPVRRRHRVRRVMQDPPRPVLPRLDPFAVVELAEHLQRQRPDRLGDQPDRRVDRGEPERLLDRHAVAGIRLPRPERVEQPLRRMREPGRCDRNSAPAITRSRNPTSLGPGAAQPEHRDRGQHRTGDNEAGRVVGEPAPVRDQAEADQEACGEERRNHAARLSSLHERQTPVLVHRR